MFACFRIVLRLVGEREDVAGRPQDIGGTLSKAKVGLAPPRATRVDVHAVKNLTALCIVIQSEVEKLANIAARLGSAVCVSLLDATDARIALRRRAILQECRR